MCIIKRVQKRKDIIQCICIITQLTKLLFFGFVFCEHINKGLLLRR